MLEAWANGIPVVLPDHAAFPELVASTGGGLLSVTDNAESLNDMLRQVLQDSNLRTNLAEAGYRGVRQQHDFSRLAGATIEKLGIFSEDFQR